MSNAVHEFNQDPGAHGSKSAKYTEAVLKLRADRETKTLTVGTLSYFRLSGIFRAILPWLESDSRGLVTLANESTTQAVLGMVGEC